MIQSSGAVRRAAPATTMPNRPKATSRILRIGHRLHRPTDKEGAMKPAVRSMLDTTPREVNRRSFFKTLGLGAAGAMALTGEAAADAAAGFVQAGVKRASEPSALRITDLRTAVVVGAPMTCPLIRLDTNQGPVGWGGGRARPSQRARR